MLLCISTSKWVLHISLAWQNTLFSKISPKKKAHEKWKIMQKRTKFCFLSNYTKRNIKRWKTERKQIVLANWERIKKSFISGRIFICPIQLLKLTNLFYAKICCKFLAFLGFLQQKHWTWLFWPAFGSSHFSLQLSKLAVRAPRCSCHCKIEHVISCSERNYNACLNAPLIS